MEGFEREDGMIRFAFSVCHVSALERIKDRKSEAGSGRPPGVQTQRDGGRTRVGRRNHVLVHLTGMVDRTGVHEVGGDRESKTRLGAFPSPSTLLSAWGGAH